jgi:hypothetical protein
MRHLLNPQWMVQTLLTTLGFLIVQAFLHAGWNAEVTRDILDLKTTTAQQESTHARKDTLDALLRGIDWKLEMLMKRIEEKQ